MRYQAYLIVICDTNTNAILGAEIWSSPEWEQSMWITATTYVVYAMGGQNFHTAKMSMLDQLNDPRCHYHRFLRYLDKTKSMVSESDDDGDVQSSE